MNRFISSFKEFSNFQKAVFCGKKIQNTNVYKNNNWMKNLKDDLFLSEITLPGTHDSCALYEPFKASAKCQKLTITDQLNMGVRFLDLRTHFVFKKIYMVHSFVYMGSELKSILSEIYEFLKLNPTEAVIVSFKTDLPSINPFNCPYDFLKSEISAHNNYWYSLNKMPKLNDVRGKIVLLNRLSPIKDAPKNYGKATDIGLTPENHFSSPKKLWEDNNIFTINSGELSYHIQDFYLIKNGDLSKKWAFIKGGLEKAAKEKDFSKNIYINFLSGLTGALPNIERVDNYIKPKMAEFLSKNPKGHYGAIPMDFANEDIVKQLINTNF